MSFGDDDLPWDAMAQEDLIGMDRLARSFIRMISRMEAGSLVGVHGAPGSAKSEFLRRVAWLISMEQQRLGDGAPGACWYNPWSYSKQGHILSGLVARVARSGGQPRLVLERARDVVSQINRLRFDGTPPDTPGSGLGGPESDPVNRCAQGFAHLVEAVKAGRRGRFFIFIDDVDFLSPQLRLQLLDGLRLMTSGDADVVVVVCVGQEEALSAIRAREGDVPSRSAMRSLDGLLDMTVTVPNLDVRRISSLLRRYLGNNEQILLASFGPDAVLGLGAAVAHRPLGSPRFLRRLAWRVTLLAEYAQEVRATRELTEAQWAWVIVSERWPDFRRFMIRGGRGRWRDLKGAVAHLGEDGSSGAGPGQRAVAERLSQDLILSDYLRLHADGFERDSEGIFWLENLLLAAGL